MTSVSSAVHAQTMRALASIVLGEHSLGAVLARVTDIAAGALPDVQDVSVTLIDERHERSRSDRPRARSVAFHRDLAVALDERQYESGRGPCLDAAASGMTISVDTESNQLYPEFCAAARRRDVPHTLSVGLSLPGRTIGGLNLYAMSGQAFTDDEIGLAEELAAFTAVAVANATVVEDAIGLSRDLEEAMRSRASIEQAKGIVMERFDCDQERAFEILRSVSSRTNTKLRDVAARVVARDPDVIPAS
jgi:GAF domain-containing protein